MKYRIETSNQMLRLLNHALWSSGTLLLTITLFLCDRGVAAEPEYRVRTLLGGEYWAAETAREAPEYLKYLAQVKPDLIHVGVLGPELASMVHARGKHRTITPFYLRDGAKMRDYLEGWQEFLGTAHGHDIKVQATFSLVNVWGDHRTNTGWFGYYKELWETELLGERPHADVRELMERNAHGEILAPEAKSNGDWLLYSGCVNSPYWRRTLKAMVRVGVEAGFDGFMVQYPHARGPCACEFCQQAFRVFLQRKYSPVALARKFSIHNLDEYIFETTGARGGLPGPIDLEAREFAAISVKQCFDDVFARYGRSLKPDLIVSMWTHFRSFLAETTDNTQFADMMDERALLPVERWGKGESYIWYCSPALPAGFSNTRLKDEIVGDQTLEWKYARAMAGRTPILIQKYDYFRWRLTTAEALASGGIVFGAWKGGWSGGHDREPVHLRSYFNFIRANDQYLHPRDSFADGAILFPRSAFYSGDATFLDAVRYLGRGLITGHILFDLLIDEKMTAEALNRYRFILIPTTRYLSAGQERLLDEYRAAGGTVLVLPTDPPPENKDSPAVDDRGRRIYWGRLKDREAIATAVREATGGSVSTFDATWTVQVHADRQPKYSRLVVHFVNYNRNEELEQRESPIAAGPVAVDLRMPNGERVTEVKFLTPEVRASRNVAFTQTEERLRFRTPHFLVYGLAVVEYE